IALSKRGLLWQREVEIPIAYDDVIITKRRVDFVIEDEADQLILETKAASQIRPEDVERWLTQDEIHDIVNFVRHISICE
ncbi:MAG: hypothetical protein JSV61_08430, partial [Anaerolineales bacterium]